MYKIIDWRVKWLEHGAGAMETQKRNLRKKTKTKNKVKRFLIYKLFRMKLSE